MKQLELDNVVRQYLISKGRNQMNGYSRYLQLAIMGLNDIHADFGTEEKIAKLSVNRSNFTINLPEDVLELNMIFFNNTSGYIEPFVQLTGMSYALDGSCYTPGANISPNAQQVNPSWADDNFRSGDYVGRDFGSVSGSRFTYTKNPQTNQVQLSSNAPSSVYVSYKGSPSIVNKKHMVHPYYVEPIMFYMDWAESRFKNNVSPGEKAEKHRQYINSKDKLGLRLARFSLHDAIDAVRQTTRLAPKI